MNGTVFFLRYCLLDLLRRPLLVGLLCCVLTVVGFYAYQNVAMEFYYSWPYATMGAKALASYDLESDSVEDEDLHPEQINANTFVEDYHVLVEHEGVMIESVLHGVSDPAPDKIDETIFNARALGCDSLDLDGVWIDETLARELGVGLLDEIHLIQRLTGVELSANVTAIVPTYAPTQGIVVRNDLVKAMTPFSLNVYETDREGSLDFELLVEDAEVAVVVQTREDACLSAKLMAQEFLPFARDDVLQIAGVCLSAGAFFIFFSMVTRRQTKRFFRPLANMGLHLRGITTVVAMELGMVAVPISAFAALASIVGLKLSYGLPISLMLFFSTTALLLGGVLFGGVCVVLALYVRLTRWRG